MNFLDMKTVLVTLLATDILCTMVLVQLWRQSRERFAGTGLWALDFAFHTAALFLLLLRGIVPDWMSVVLANTMILAGALWGYMGLQRFVGQEGPQRHNTLLLAAFVLIHSYFTFVQPELRWRNINISMGLLIICGQCLWLMLVKVRPPMRSLTRGVGLVFGAFCLHSIFRIFWHLTAPDIGQDQFHASGLEVLVFVLYQLLLILLTYSLSLMVNKRLLRGIEHEEEKLSKVFHCSPYAILLTRLSDGKVIEVNDSFVTITGYSRTEVLGKTTLDLHLWQSMEDRDAVVSELSRQGSLQSREHQFWTKAGEARTGLVSVETITLDNEKSALSTIVDITERQCAERERLRLEQRLQQAQKAQSLGRMAGAVAHHFNNKLMAVMGYLELVLGKVEPDARTAAMVRGAWQAAEQAAEMSNLMLAYLGQTTAKLVPLNLTAVCREVLADQLLLVPERLSLESDVGPESLVIKGNQAMVGQILANLITNAREAIGEEQGAIRVSLRVVPASATASPHLFPIGWEPEAELYACMEVSDTGCGIAPEQLDTVFDPFFTTKFTGRGLGLAVLQGTVRLHGGAVAVVSTPGGGSTFRVFWPLEAQNVQPAQQPVEGVPRPLGSLGLILVVDDDPEVLTIAQAMLNHLGGEVLMAGNGAEAIEIFQARKDEIRLVLLDLTMPGMDGWQTLAELRRLRPDVPVILASGYDEAQVMRGEHPEQPQVFLHKPYHSRDLAAAVEIAFRSSPD